ncbi:1-phosphofructokinase family hexose kinase [Paraburkholderia sp. SARCC-3016]|uniref:1-phosphofructokinase family hexose kinase n=1 Tax=Paraburkholderia sp. SARCC-3016 TaxID=3058611 RepID=UPI00280A4604|nr:1-phosphofructokinase family hexose kinase [Paraburkholderia sp. SARCC-3016]MDQ7976833.1 1-phosphofructokinase family hexose kinase [Paraburkholderia sp. SARCC-3016]
MNMLTVTLNPAVDISTSVERIADTHKLRCAAARRDPGGGGINVARVLHRLGADCTAFLLAGGGSGHTLLAMLADEGLHTQALEIAGETRENFSVFETATGREYRFVLPGPAVAPDEWTTCRRRVQAGAAAARFMVLSGSLPPGLSRDAYAQLARDACEVRPDIRIAVDASGPALAAALDSGLVDIVKPSLAELCELTGKALSDAHAQADAGRALIEAGKARIVAITLGSQGALLVTSRQTCFMAAVPTEVRSAIGAGDSFLAGLLWALDQGASDGEALHYAAAAAAATLRQPGTRLCDARDVVRAYAKGERPLVVNGAPAGIADLCAKR